MPTRADVLREVRHSRQRRQRVRLISFLVLLLLILVGVIFFLNSYILISKIEVVGTQVVEEEQVISKVDEVLSGRAWLVFPRRSVLFYPELDLVTVLKTSFPRLSQIEITKLGAGVLRLMVSERESQFIVCRLKECFYSDAGGRLFVSAPSFSGNPLLVIEAPVETSLQLGSDFETTQTLKWIRDFTSQLGLALESSLFRGERAVEVNFGEKEDLKFLVRDPERAAKGWTLLVSRRTSPESALENLAAALSSDVFKQELVARRLELDYIDLRFERKVFYKFLSSAIIER